MNSYSYENEDIKKESEDICRGLSGKRMPCREKVRKEGIYEAERRADRKMRIYPCT